MKKRTEWRGSLPVGSGLSEDRLAATREKSGRRFGAGRGGGNRGKGRLKELRLPLSLGREKKKGGKPSLAARGA